MRDRIREKLKFSIISFIVVAIALYAYFETSEMLRGPVVEIDNPKNGYSAEESLVEISGKVKNISYMYLNGRPIFADTSGNLKEKITLAEGYNSIFIEAKDRTGKKSAQIIELVFNKKDKDSTESLAKETTLSPSL